MNKAGKRRAAGVVLWIVVAVALLGVVALGIWGRRKAGRAEDKPVESVAAEGRVLDVEVMEVVPVEARDLVEIPGHLEPFADATVAAEKGGRIVELAVDKGDPVKAGQVVARLNDRLWRAMALQAEVQAREADREWERWEALKDSGAVSPSDLDAVRKARDLAAAAREQAQAALAQCEVHSPIDGVVADRFREPGEYAMEGVALLRLVDVARLKLVLDVPEQDVSAVEVGRDVTFVAQAAGGQAFSGTVCFVSPVAAQANNSYHTEIEVDNRDGRLKAGMIASATLVRRVRPDAIVVPLSSIVPDQGEHVAFVVEDGRAVRRTVHIDAIQGQNVVLLDGISRGDRLVVAGQRGLKDGRAVKVVEP